MDCVIDGVIGGYKKKEWMDSFLPVGMVCMCSFFSILFLFYFFPPINRFPPFVFIFETRNPPLDLRIAIKSCIGLDGEKGLTLFQSQEKTGPSAAMEATL